MKNPKSVVHLPLSRQQILWVILAPTLKCACVHMCIKFDRPQVYTACWSQWCNSWEVGAECLPDTSHWEISADLPGKERQGKQGKWRKKEGKLKKEGGKLKMEGEKLQNKEGPFFFPFLFFFTFQNLWNLFWVLSKLEFSTRKKHFMTGKKKSGKMTFPPLKNVPLMRLAEATVSRKANGL